uniref:Uncharacterized protein n=1 Tax=Hanusia phi TaxID=3032 RepID=A0A7S0HHD6_9CRYP
MLEAERKFFASFCDEEDLEELQLDSYQRMAGGQGEKGDETICQSTSGDELDDVSQLPSRSKIVFSSLTSAAVDVAHPSDENPARKEIGTVPSPPAPQEFSPPHRQPPAIALGQPPRPCTENPQEDEEYKPVDEEQKQQQQEQAGHEGMEEEEESFQDLKQLEDALRDAQRSLKEAAASVFRPLSGSAYEEGVEEEGWEEQEEFRRDFNDFDVFTPPRRPLTAPDGDQLGPSSFQGPPTPSDLLQLPNKLLEEERKHLQLNPRIGMRVVL